MLVADDGSRDATAAVAAAGGAEVVSAPRPLGKGGAATLAALRLLDRVRDPAGAPVIVLLCDGDLGASAARLSRSSTRSARARSTSRWPPSPAAWAAGSAWPSATRTAPCGG